MSGDIASPQSNEHQLKSTGVNKSDFTSLYQSDVAWLNMENHKDIVFNYIVCFLKVKCCVIL